MLKEDTTLLRILKETADELDVQLVMVTKVYNHFYNFIYKIMTEDNLAYYNTEEKVKRAKNISIPGFGRLLNSYGKVFRDKGIKEEFHKNKTINYGTKDENNPDC